MNEQKIGDVTNSLRNYFVANDEHDKKDKLDKMRNEWFLANNKIAVANILEVMEKTVNDREGYNCDITAAKEAHNALIEWLVGELVIIADSLEACKV